MTIYLGSRYEEATVDFLALTPTGDAIPVVFYNFSDLGLMTYSEYSWKSGDRLESLAMRFYRDPELWWVIAEANPQVTDVQSIPAGTILRIPSVQ